MDKRFDERLKKVLAKDVEPLPDSYTERIAKLLENLPQNQMKHKKNFSFRYVAAVLGICLLMASGAKAAVNVYKENKNFGKELENLIKMPTSEEISTKRDEVFKGVNESDRKTVTDKVKYYNLAMEHAYLWDNIYQKMKDPDDLHWNLLYEKGEVQIGWAFESGEEYNPKKTKLSESEYNKKYGQKVTCDNDVTADDFMKEMRKIQRIFKNEVIQSDFETIIENMEQAKRTRDVEYLANIYKILHDMDYYLFRDKKEVAKYINDTSLIDKYYGVLNVYQ